MPHKFSSKRSQDFIADGIRLRVEIFKYEQQEGWTLTVTDPSGCARVWPNVFPSDDAALQTFVLGVEKYGAAHFVEDSDGKQAEIARIMKSAGIKRKSTQ